MAEAVQNLPRAIKPFRRQFRQPFKRHGLLEPSVGTWFRSEIDFREPEGKALTNAILDQISGVEFRKKALRPLDSSNRFELVKRIAANALACHHHRVQPHVAYIRTAAFYGSEPQWLNGSAMARTVGLLAECKLVESNVGKWGESASIYTPTKGLLELAEQHGAGAASIVEKLPLERLVRLRESNAGGPEVPFEGNQETEAWAKQLDAYNQFAGQHDLTVDASSGEVMEWVSKLNSQPSLSGIPLRRPELFRKGLYRTFNNGSFDQGGRLYGAWWTNAPRSVRRTIRINGEETVECDYSGHAIRMLYHEQGMDYVEDPYFIERLWTYSNENDLAEDHFREGVKTITQALINGDTDGHPERARIEDFTFKPFKRSDIRSMVVEKHKAIKKAFGSGAGIRLQRQDSDLALRIIANLKEHGILALPVHDSFLVAQRYELELIKQMESCYIDIYKLKPVIKK